MQLKRQFGLWTAVSILVGQVIAVGIFLTPAGMAKSVGSPFWLLIIWLLMGLMALCGALCYGELASRFPEAGGSYVYLREAFGKPLAFLYGWMVLLVLDPGLTAIFAVGLTSYVDYLMPMSPFAKQIFSVLTIAVVAILNILGTKLSGNILQFLTFLKVGTLFFLVVYGFVGSFGDWNNFTPFFAMPQDTFGAIIGGFVGAFFAFAGWWEVSRIAGEIENPEKNLPKALAIGVIILTVIYIATSGEALFGQIGGKIFSIIVIVSVLGTLVAYLMVSPRVYYAMAKDKLFFAKIAELHPKFNTPHRATLIQVLLASILILLGNFEQILSYFFFIVVLFIGLTVAGLFKIRKAEFAGYKTPFFPVTPIIFLTLTVCVLFLIGMRNPLQTVLGIGVVALGIPVYYLVFNNSRFQIPNSKLD
jgi:basic amino acid/polyamine antiporter, APA family